jgi:hypothetical protein
MISWPRPQCLQVRHKVRLLFGPVDTMRTKGRFLLAQKTQLAHQRRFSLVVLAAQFAKIGKIYNK